MRYSFCWGSDIMMQIKAVSNSRNKFLDIEKIVNEGVESALDEADRMAMEDKTRLSHKEIFGSLRRKG